VKAPLCLFVLSADFGEFVTANLFARGQPFDSRFALPPRLAQHVPADQQGVCVYQSVADLQQLVDALHPDVVLLCSGYLFAVNGLMAAEHLAAFVKRLGDQGIGVATTDPWLAIWRLDPQTCFDIFSVRRGGVDPALSERMNALQKYLGMVFHDVDHLYAVPLACGAARQHSFFNSQFASAASTVTAVAPARNDDWLMVISREDYVMRAGLAASTFLDDLSARISEILAPTKNRLTVIGPAELAVFLRKKWSSRERLCIHDFCDFNRFEALLRQARVVIYWNVLSSSLLYCLYCRIAPIFFGTGHQVKVCRGLLAHVTATVYRGNAPPILDPAAPLEGDADVLLDRLGVMPWLDRLRADYCQLPAPMNIFNQIRRRG